MMVVVDDVDAADEGDPVVHHGDLAMQPPQQSPFEAPPDARTEHAETHPARGHALAQLRYRLLGPEGVDEQVDRDAAAGR